LSWRRNEVTGTIFYKLITLVLRLGLVAALLAAGWLIYSQLPHQESADDRNAPITSLHIVLQPGIRGVPLDIPIELYPIDVVAVRNEYFAERRAGKRYEDFLKERMAGRSKMSGRLDMQGQTTLTVKPGNWWIHALLSGSEDLEWRLPVSVTGQKQTIELTSQNAYTRSKTF
jgi:hypothetical protein